MSENRPVSPVNGQPIPEGKKWRTGDERAKKAGQKSGQARRERKTLREELIALLTEDIRDKNGNAMQTQKALSTSLLKSALNGNVRAFEIIRDTIGEKPVEKVDVQAADYTALDEAFKAMKRK